MSKSLGTDRHVREVVKSEFHYGQLVRRASRASRGRASRTRTDDRTNESGSQAQTSSTRKMFQGIIPFVLGHGVSRNVRGGGGGVSVAIVCLRRYPPTLTYHASTDDVDESGLHAPRSRAVRSRRGENGSLK